MEKIVQEISNELVERALSEIILSENLKKYDIEISAGSEKGDNYLGLLKKIVLVDKSKNTIKRKSYIIKLAPRENVMRNYAPYNEFFKREIFAYTKALPYFYKLQSTALISSSSQLMPTAELLKSSSSYLNEFMIMNDLKNEGFIMRDRMSTLDLPHCKLVLKQIGYLHAFSFILKKIDPVVYKEFKNATPDIFFQNLNKDMFREQCKQLAKKAAGSMDPLKDKDILLKLEPIMENGFDILLEIADPTYNDDYCVLLHGDCWNNNLLFKYDNLNKNKEPIELRLLDWQLMHWGSPAIDLSYFLYNSTSLELRQAHFNELIDYYYSSVCEMMQQFNCDPNELFPKRKLFDHMKKYFKYGLCMAFVTIQLFTSSGEEIPDYDELQKEGEINFKHFNFESKNDAIYKERMSGVLRDFVGRDYIE